MCASANRLGCVCVSVHIQRGTACVCVGQTLASMGEEWRCVGHACTYLVCAHTRQGVPMHGAGAVGLVLGQLQHPHKPVPLREGSLSTQSLAPEVLRVTGLALKH